MKTKILKATGRVQGVGFRYFVQKQAMQLGVKGEVKNQPDGSVLIIAQAAGIAMAEFITKVESGPSFSRVNNLLVNDQERAQEYVDFKITY